VTGLNRLARENPCARSGDRRVRFLALVLCAAVPLTSNAFAGATTRTRVVRSVDLTITGGYGLVSGVGDVNGDGENDILVGSCANDNKGLVYVIFGPFATENIDVSNLGDRGFVIEGSEAEEGSFPGDRACFPARAGDVNGDGLDDVLVGAPHASHNNRASSGCVYVVFGKASTEAVRLAEFDLNVQSTKGFRIDGAFDRSMVGNQRTFEGAGDLNGDGLADIITGAAFAGATYVVFGKTDPVPVDLLGFHMDTPPPGGYRIDTPTPSRDSGYSAAGAGDVNGDGLPDVVIGVIRRPSSRGTIYVVFGKASRTSQDVSRLGKGGFRVLGAYPGSMSGHSLTGVGDITGDGLSEIALGAPASELSGRGATYVVFGKKNNKPLSVNDLGRHGFVIVGSGETADSFGDAVAAAGDVNGDGKPDLIVGAPTSAHGGFAAGSVYVIYLGRYSGKLRAERLGRKGYRVDVGRRLNSVGGHVTGPGDLNSDGTPDVVFGNLGTGDVYGSWGR
jgi:hypothetical protein